jgi:hypothetical protein
MPNKVLKSFAKKSGKSMRSLEHMWKTLDKAYDENKSKYGNKYAFIVGVMQKNLHLLKESEFDSALRELSRF